VISGRKISAELECLIADLNGPAPNTPLLGVGVDLETNRSVHPDTARFFLTEGEQEWLKSLGRPDSSEDLLRLWTVKEALLKADPETGKMLGDYAIEDPSQWTGNAYPKDRKFLRFRYSSLQVDGGFLSIAILAKG